MEIQEKLVLIKKYSGKTQESLARELGVSFPTINSWILGKSQPRAKAQQRIEAWFLLITGKNIVSPQSVELKKKLIMQLQSKHTGIIRQLSKRPDLYDQFLLSLTYNTNRIEGSTLTEPETAAILFQNSALRDKSIIEQMEVKNHQAAFSFIFRHVAEKMPFSEECILRMHAILMNGIRDDAGRYRSHAVRIAGAHVPTANYLKVPDLMKELISTIIKNDSTDIIGFSARTHSRFEQIHPFSDGNGRVGRLLLWAMLLARDIVPAVISQEYRRYYIMYLNQSQLNGDHSKLDDFICDAINASYRIFNHE